MSTKHKPKYKRIAQLKTVNDFREYAKSVGADLPLDQTLQQPAESPYQKAFTLKSGRIIGNRFCILPMEGWDGTSDGKPSEYTRRRWKNFAISGAKLLWGCEAVAVCHEGRANPNQLLIEEKNLDEYKRLFELLQVNHHNKFGRTDDLLVGLQLTHSGRFCKPNDKKMEPMILYHHPLLNKKFGLGADYPVMSDDYIDKLIDAFVQASVWAHQAGFHFVDIKHCHGYLGHEFLSAHTREGKYGGSFENRTRFLTSVVAGIKAEAPGLEISVRLSAFDWKPFYKGEDGFGVPEKFSGVKYEYAFGSDDSGVNINLAETNKFLTLLEALGIQLVCTTAGSPYYNPHIQRPALFPPSDGYQPPEDPLVGVARQLHITALIKKSFPDLAIVGSAYSYLQEWLPYVGQYLLNHDMTDFIGLGRMVLSYPELPEDILNGHGMKREKICRTFSDCTTAPRNGMLSGCFPLDDFYKALPEATLLKNIKSDQ